MRDKASSTAAWVALSRTLGQKLPRSMRLADDPYGAKLVGPRAALFAEHVPGALTAPLWPWVLYMQLRTRTIDDVLCAFLAGGGRQLVILGAGYDCRAARFGAELGAARVFEVDHPATQARKREALAASEARQVCHLPWDFERRAVAELPEALRAEGHAPAEPTLTLWEGVTMYLSEAAIEATVGAVRAYSAPRSELVLSYIDRAQVERPSPLRALVARMVARAGEPFRFGWRPAELPAWLAARGFALEWDRDTVEQGRSYLSPRSARLLGDWARSQHIALARRRG